MSEKQQIITISLKDGEPSKEVKKWLNKINKEINEIFTEEKMQQQYINLYLFGESGTKVSFDSETKKMKVEVEDLMKKYYEQKTEKKEL